ncbi:MAG: type II toxin-antitoxin system RelE/ParE family toxin [Thermoplasmata archaeon]
MTWGLEVSPEFEQDYRKLCGRNAAFKNAVDSKVSQILENPLHYKPLRAPLQGIRRVHIGGSFVLMFEPIPVRHTVRLLRLAHHDEAYGV